MRTAEFARIAKRLLSHPAAPFHEHAVRAEVEQICREHQLPVCRDRFGNVIVRHAAAQNLRPLLLAAHMDHPGFEMLRRSTDRQIRARFLGGVPREYFQPGVRLRLMPGALPARLGKPTGKALEFLVSTETAVSTTPKFAVWELVDCVVGGGRIHARACDDLIGVAAILAALIELKRARARVNVWGLISRAEEVGFNGALALAASGSIPKRALIVSLETSRELAGVKQGGGVILRVGDRTSIFDSEATRFLSEVGAELKSNRRSFKVQRALMSGGTCEATAYQEFGFQTAAVCIALGNYHNCGPRGRIKAEHVHLGDAVGMVELLVEAARRMKDYPRLVNRLPARLRSLQRNSAMRLRRTA